MFLGEDDSLADACEASMPHLTVLRVKHAAAAVDRMVVTRPLVVVIDETVREDVGEVVARAQDVLAEVVRGPRPVAELLESIRAAVLVAERKRAQLG